MSKLASARLRIVLNTVLVGVGVSIFFLPDILFHSGVIYLPPLLQFLFFIAGLYVVGWGIAGVIEGGIRMARSLSD